MNLLNIDIKNYIPNIVDAYTEVFGEEYRNIIRNKLNNIQYIIYNNEQGINDYVYFLERCKEKELNIKFLKQIGINVSEYERESYTKELDEEFQMLIRKYINGIKSFDTDIDISQIDFSKPQLEESWRILNQIKLLNMLKSPETEEITTENYVKFYNNDEYKMIRVTINDYIEKYRKIEKEREEYDEKIEEYRKYGYEERKRKQDILDSKANELFEEIRNTLPKDVLAVLDNKYKSDTKKRNVIFNEGYIDEKADIEYFSEEDNDKLNDPDIEEKDKNWIYYYRMSYFENLGCDVGKLRLRNINRDKYEELIEKEEIKKLIPSTKTANEITKCRKRKYEEAKKEYIYTKKEFIEAINRIGGEEYIYDECKENSVCLSAGFDTLGTLVPILFYTVRKGDGGILDYTMLHELCHAIEYHFTLKEDKLICGFDDASKNPEMNPYNKQKRKYERINENITDIFTIEARKILQNKGIYMIEDKEHTDNDAENCNTYEITKTMLKPLLNKYRRQVIKARITGDRQQLYDTIGEENFEELNDAINKVDYLLNQGLISKLNINQKEDSLVIEYNEQMERLDRIYTNMELCASKNNKEIDEQR